MIVTRGLGTPGGLLVAGGLGTAGGVVGLVFAGIVSFALYIKQSLGVNVER